ncbi:hypothetical protein RB653_000785 [Dictyostelium firmibasis]|uniref:Probable UDP-N-acetylglucosamine--peptide N-acetylglucosaminyltransferase SPINDLY n=1 Tax=Dictyostelium firmibasis TaxID=79012 RepID=A0AAN7YW72_9MYCE
MQICYDIIIHDNPNLVNVEIIKKDDITNNNNNNKKNNIVNNFVIVKLNENNSNNSNNNNIYNNEIIRFLNKLIEIKVINNSSDVNDDIIKIDEFLIEVGTEFREKKKMIDALKMYYLASRSNINNSTALFYMGVVFYEEGISYELALESYSNALLLNPNYPEVLCNIGVIRKNLGEIEASIEYYNRALQINPNYSLVKNNLAIAYNDLGTKVKLNGDIDLAKKFYKKSLHHNFKYEGSYYNLGVLFSERKQIEKSIMNYELAIHFNEINNNIKNNNNNKNDNNNNQYVEALNNLGVLYKDIDNIEKSIHYYQLALKSNPTFSQSLSNLAIIYTMQGKMSLAKKHVKQAIKESPTYADAYNNLGVVYRDIGKISNSIKSYEKCIQCSPTNSLNAQHNKLLALNYSTEFNHLQIFNLHKQWGQSFLNSMTLKCGNNNSNNSNNGGTSCGDIENNKKDRLIIGYISGDFFIHSVSYFIEGILKFHNKEEFKIICYSNISKQDSTTERLKSYGHEWRHINGKPTMDVVQLIKADKVDILVELSGHTCGNRMDVMALQPAPIQITYIGYPNTSGLKTIQYRITDSIVDPLDTKQQFTETLIRMPLCFLTYFPPTNMALSTDNIIPPPVIKNGYITFGSFNVMAKYSDSCLRCWKLVMDRSPIGTRLLLKSKPFACEDTKKSFTKRLIRFGFNLNQVDLVGLFPNQKDHLQYYSKMLDISLDTFPYAGTTTTCESLWMGVPTVSLSTPDYHCNNVGKSILHTLNLSQLIAYNDDQYIEIALSLSKDIEKLLLFRRNLRNLMINSPLCDNSNFTKNLELKYKQIFNFHHHPPTTS